MEAGRMGECAILRHWGLIRPDLTQPSGHWFLTELGQDFVRGDVEVPFAIWHWNKKRYGATTRTISLRRADRKSTRLNSSHLGISYAVFCLKKKKTKDS